MSRWGGYPGSIVDWFENKGPAYLDGIRRIPLLEEDDRASALEDHPEAFIMKWFWPDPVGEIIGFITSWSHAGPNWQRAAVPAIDEACRRWQEAPDDESLGRAATDIQLLSAEHIPSIPLYSTGGCLGSSPTRSWVEADAKQSVPVLQRRLALLSPWTGRLSRGKALLRPRASGPRWLPTGEAP